MEFYEVEDILVYLRVWENTSRIIVGVILALSLLSPTFARGDDSVTSESWGVRAYDAAVLLEVTGFPDCQADAVSCRSRHWSLTVPAMRTPEAAVFVAAPAGALLGALRATLRLPGEVAPREVVQVPIPSRLGIAVLVVAGSPSSSTTERLPPIPVQAEGQGGRSVLSMDGDEVVWILSRSLQDPAAPAQTLSGRLVYPDSGPGESTVSRQIRVEPEGTVSEGGGFVCDVQGAFIGLIGRAGETWVLVPKDRISQALALAAVAVRAGIVDTTPGRSPAIGVLDALEAFVAYRATGAADGANADIIVDERGTTLRPAAKRLLETAHCKAQQAWRSLVEARADQNTDHVELLTEYWEWVQSPSFHDLQGCLGRESGTAVLLSCFVCYPPSPHRAVRRSPSPLFTEALYFRLLACDDVGLRTFCAECLLYERYEDLMDHAGLEDEWLLRLLPFVRHIDREVFGHRLEPECDAKRP